jgi:hypothetical protein
MTDHTRDDDPLDAGTGSDIEVQETDDDQASEVDSTASAARSVADSVAETIGGGIRALLARIVGTLLGVLLVVTKVLPKGHVIWAGMYKRGLKGMHKTAGGDVVGLIGRNTGQLDIQPMKWKRDDDDVGEKPRWVTKGTNEEFFPGAEGRDFDLIGNVPVALFDEDNPNRATRFEARFAEALDVGAEKTHIYADADVTQVIQTVDPGSGADQQGAVADGGQVTQQFQIDEPGYLEDVLVDLSSPEWASGTRVSATKVKETYQEKVGTEEMQNQEQRGRIAESDPEAERQKWLRAMLYMMLAVAAAAMGPELVAAIFGSGGVGGGGGSVMPFALVPPIPGVTA